MQRKEFIKKSCLSCFSIAIGTTIVSMMSGCNPLPIYKTTSINKLVEVDTMQFPLNKNMLVVKCKGIDFDILLIKKNESTFTALYMMCTHERQPLGATNKGLYCSSHGSGFDLDGNVTNQPATKSLTKLQTSVNNQIITINLNNIL